MAPKRSPDGGSGEKSKKAKTAAAEVPDRSQQGGSMYYILKKPADVLTVEDMEKAPDSTVAITGVKAPQTRKVLETMQKGDSVLFYQSPAKGSKDKAFVPAITAHCTIVKGPYPDPTDGDGKLRAVDIKVEEVFDDPITLDMLKAHKDGELKGLTLFTNNLLTVHHVSKAMFERICDL